MTEAPISTYFLKKAMGSASHAISVIKQNRALQRTGNKSFLNLPIQKRTDLRQRSYSAKNWRESYRKSHVMPWHTKVLLLLMAVCTVALFMFLNNWLNKPQFETFATPPTFIDSAERVSEIEQVNSLYVTYQKRGDRLYEKGNYYLAYQDYKVALRLLPTGRKANFGMALSLDKLCEYRNMYCDDAASYAAAMKNW